MVCNPVQVGLRQLLRRLEKEKAEVEWQLRDCEWRLDQEAAVSSLCSVLIFSVCWCYIFSI